MKDKMILKDGTVMEMEACASLGAVQILSADCAEMAATWEKLTDENLQEVQIQNGEGLTVGRYQDLILVSETSVRREEGDILTAYSFREKTIGEKRMDQMEQEQEIQNGAITEIGAMVAGGEA